MVKSHFGALILALGTSLASKYSNLKFWFLSKIVRSYGVYVPNYDIIIIKVYTWDYWWIKLLTYLVTYLLIQWFEVLFHFICVYIFIRLFNHINPDSITFYYFSVPHTHFIRHFSTVSLHCVDHFFSFKFTGLLFLL